MTHPRFHKKIFAFIALIALVAFTPLALSQPPTAPAEGSAAEKKQARPPRVKPQVIYRLPKTSRDAAALHSQAKAENDTLPIDSSMPTSLQLSRSNANAAAAQATSPTPSAQIQSKDAGNRKQHRRPAAKAARARAPSVTRSVKAAPARAPAPKRGNNP